MSGSLNDTGVCDIILKQTTAESAAYFWGNITKGVQDSTKGALAVDSEY